MGEKWFGLPIQILQGDIGGGVNEGQAVRLMSNKGLG